jgi:hypothetical protein
VLKKTVTGTILMLLLVSTLSSAFHAVTSTTDRTLSILYKEAVSEGELSAQWNKTYGGILDDYAFSVVQTIDGGFAIAGYTYSFGIGGTDFWLVKTDGDGNMEWNKTYGGVSDDFARSVVQTSDGGFAIAGYITNLSYDSDFWLVKTDVNGDIEWNKTYGETKTEYGRSVVQTVDGGYVIAGQRGLPWTGASAWLVKTDGDGNMEWNKTYPGDFDSGAFSVVQTSDGGFAIPGYTLTFWGDSDFWLVKTDANGNTEWDRQYGGTNDESPQSVVQTSDGGYAIAGFTYSFGAGGTDFWLVKTDGDGNMEWNKTYGGTLDDYAGSVIQTTDGGYTLAGWTESFGAGSHDFWLVKTDGDGNMEWNKTYGGTQYDSAYSVVQTIDEGYAIAGYTRSFGVGAADFWLVKFLPYHDIGLVNVASSKTVVGQDFPVSINATVENQGFYLETFNVTAYADLVTPPIGDEIVIGRRTIVNLLIGESQIIQFQWDTAGLAKGNYTISAVANNVSDDIDTIDNTYTNGIVTIAMVGDIIPDGIVDIFDLVAVAVWFGSAVPPAAPNSDIIEDKLIDIYDLVTVALHYGETDL